MDLENMKTDVDGYLVNGSGEKIVFFVCDPAKNFLCDKTMCRAAAGCEDEGEIGFCSSTPEPAFRKEGTRPFYKRLNSDGYFGREYIEEVSEP